MCEKIQPKDKWHTHSKMFMKGRGFTQNDRGGEECRDSGSLPLKCVDAQNEMVTCCQWCLSIGSLFLQMPKSISFLPPHVILPLVPTLEV